MVILIFYLAIGLMSPNICGALDFTSTKPIICNFNGNKIDSENPAIPNLDPSNIPSDCEVIAFTGFSINNQSCINVTIDILEQVTCLNRTVLLVVYREYALYDWATILTPDGNAEDAKAITDFATSNNIQGVILYNIGPMDTDEPIGDVSKNIIPYLKQLKISDDFIVGVYLDPYSKEYFTNPCVYDLDGMADIVDLYIINTFLLNACQPVISNSATPLHESPDGEIGLDTVVGYLNETSIPPEKIYLVIEIYPIDTNSSELLSSYSDVCLGKADANTWCIPTTKDYYEKAQYVKEQCFGINVKWIELDDILNECECCEFIGLKNIAAGFNDGSQIPCEKFDIDAGTPPEA